MQVVFSMFYKTVGGGNEIFAAIREYWPGKDALSWAIPFFVLTQTLCLFFFIYSLLLHPLASSCVNTYLITNHNEAPRADVPSRKALRKGYERLLPLQAADKLAALWDNTWRQSVLPQPKRHHWSHCVHAGVQLAGHRRTLSLLSPAFAFLTQRGTLWLIYF